MRHAATLRRSVRVTLAALVVVGATALGAGEADAGGRPGTTARTKLTVEGSVTRHDSCEGQLAVSVSYTRKTGNGDRTTTRAATIDEDGGWSTTLTFARPELYYVSAVLVGHRAGPVRWAEDRVRVRRNQAHETDLGTVRIAGCDG